MDNHSVISAILEETGKAVLGKEDVLKKILTAIIAGGKQFCIIFLVFNLFQSGL